jgi:F-type H+-transporting ATPase subunit b
MMKKLFVSVSLTLIYATTAYASDADIASSHHAEAVGDAHGHHEASAGLPQLDPTYFTSQAFWIFVVFVLMYVVFSTKSLPAMSQVIENRDDRIKNDLSSAEQVKKEVQSVQESYEESLKEAREKSAALFTEIEAKIKHDSEKHAAEYAEKSAQKVSELEESIQNARKQAIKDMSDVAAEIASDAAEKIIGVRADEKTAKKVVATINKAA